MKPNINDFFYHITPRGRYLRKIKVINGPYFEWLWGWDEVSKLTKNTDKSKVKFILDTK
jgi:hypothetical protein